MAKLQLCLQGTRQEILDQLDEMRTLVGSSLDAQPSSGGAGARRGPKAAAKEAPLAEVEQEEFNFGEDAAEAEEETTIDLDDHVVPAFNAFAKKGPKQKSKCIAILKKYGVKSVRDIPQEKYAEALKSLT